MSNKIENNPSEPARVLLFSQKNLMEPEVWRGAYYEFEDILIQNESIEILAPKPDRWFKQRRRNAQRVGKYSPIILNPGIPKIKLNRHYDLFFAVCEKPSELLNVSVVEGIKDYCKTSICWLTELWEKEIPSCKAYLRVLSKFDYVLLSLSQSVEPLSKLISAKCSFLTHCTDAILFCPYPKPPARTIDVYSIGRRSEQTHQALFRMAQESKIFYVYDTLTDLHTNDIRQHRFLMANMAKRSRYFIVNPGKIDFPEETGDQSEFGSRLFEGAAAGTIMIGEHPKNKEFDKIFHWPDAVVHLPYASDKIEMIINELDRQPDRQEKIRKNNVVQSLLHHDCIYRWETILRIAGLEPMPMLYERKKRLSELSKMVVEESGDL